MLTLPVIILWICAALAVWLVDGALLGYVDYSALPIALVLWWFVLILLLVDVVTGRFPYRERP